MVCICLCICAQLEHLRSRFAFFFSTPDPPAAPARSAASSSSSASSKNCQHWFQPRYGYVSSGRDTTSNRDHHQGRSHPSPLAATASSGTSLRSFIRVVANFGRSDALCGRGLGPMMHISSVSSRRGLPKQES